jgi:hypothetical protein
MGVAAHLWGVFFDIGESPPAAFVKVLRAWLLEGHTGGRYCVKLNN